MITNITSHYDSSTLTSAEYNYKTKTLIVNFNHASYVYNGVSRSDFESFNNAESQGKALNEFIKGKYDYDKLVDENSTTEAKWNKVPVSYLEQLPPDDYQLDN